MNSFEKVYLVTSLIPTGKVLTYKKVAEFGGIKNPRVVGFALNKNKNPKIIPCHRVIKNNGTLAKGYAFGGMKKQKEILEKEGVRFVGNKINLKKYLFKIRPFLP